MSVDELLLQLKGIQAPLEPGWWPLAPTWWILLALLSVSAFTLLFYLRQQRVNRLFERANLELQRISKLYSKDQDSRALVISLSQWLRQVSLLAFPEKKTAGITGLAWVEFLDEIIGRPEFTLGPGQVFSGGVYSLTPAVDTDGILSLCSDWLISVKPRLLKRGQSQEC
jgi:hypothetical protein